MSVKDLGTGTELLPSDERKLIEVEVEYGSVLFFIDQIQHYKQPY